MSKGVTRHFKYAWIEYGNPMDAQAFTDGLYKMGWGNLLGSLPTAKDDWGQRYVDAAHPLLPIRHRGSALLALPNPRVDNEKLNFPYIKDPLFEAFRKANGDIKFDEAIDKQNEFIASWLLSPGLKKVSDSEVRLTADNDFTDFADWAVISGHGANGRCWGGGSGAELGPVLQAPPDPSTDRLKWIVIATCYNVVEYMAERFIPAMRRANPIHGFLGYGDGYPGDEPGAVFFQNFARNMSAKANAKAAPGTKTILDAWREAHSSAKNIWAAVVHTGSVGDNMKDWLGGTLPTPPSAGEIRWFDEKNYPTGIVVTDRTPPYTVFFVMGGSSTTKIFRENTMQKNVGLFPGDSGFLAISKTSGPFAVGDVITITFFYYRPEKDGMDLSKLLVFSKSSDGDFTLKTDLNKRDRSANVDSLEFKFTKETSDTSIPYTVAPDSTKFYHLDGENHGYFNLRVTPPGATVGGRSDLRPYTDGAWLRPKKP